jgi:hypothetical protein
VISGVRCVTNAIEVDFFNVDLLAAHSLTGTVIVRSFEV